MKTCPICDKEYPDGQNTCPEDGAVLLASQELAPGTLVRGKYRILRKLGQGGMGVVYLAEDSLMGVQVALKFLATELSRDPQFVKRFRTEARAAYSLRHPNITEVTGLDQSEDGSLFIAMEFVDGPSLRDLMEGANGPLDITRALTIARGIAAGLASAHAKGMVHRDIKPENVLLGSTETADELPKILDFGIVAMTENLTRVSHTRGLLLTPTYAAPEQWRGMRSTELDGRTDLYALGGVLYEMLAGQTAFVAHNTEGWMFQHIMEPFRPLREVRPELFSGNEQLDALVLSLLAKNRDERPASAAVVVRELDNLLREITGLQDGFPEIAQSRADDRTQNKIELSAKSQFPTERPKPVETRVESGETAKPPVAPWERNTGEPTEISSIPQQPIAPPPPPLEWKPSASSVFAATEPKRAESSAQRPLRWQSIVILVLVVALSLLSLVGVVRLFGYQPIPAIAATALSLGLWLIFWRRNLSTRAGAATGFLITLSIFLHSFRYGISASQPINWIPSQLPRILMIFILVFVARRVIQAKTHGHGITVPLNAAQTAARLGLPVVLSLFLAFVPYRWLSQDRYWGSMTGVALAVSASFAIAHAVSRRSKSSDLATLSEGEYSAAGNRLTVRGVLAGTAAAIIVGMAYWPLEDLSFRYHALDYLPGVYHWQFVLGQLIMFALGGCTAVLIDNLLSRTAQQKGLLNSDSVRFFATLSAALFGHLVVFTFLAFR
jgi:serine/threonine protein kinase/uncharacterized membrane protein